GRRIRASPRQHRSSLTAENPSKDPAEDGPQCRDNGNPDRQALAVPRIRAERVVGKHRKLKAYSTQETYEGYLKKWIVPRWGSYRLGDVKAVKVEQWLKTGLAPFFVLANRPDARRFLEKTSGISCSR